MNPITITSSKNTVTKLNYYSNGSLTYDIKTEEVYDNFWIDKVKFDKSDYPRLVSSTFPEEVQPCRWLGSLRASVTPRAMPAGDSSPGRATHAGLVDG